MSKQTARIKTTKTVLMAAALLAIMATGFLPVSASAARAPVTHIPKGATVTEKTVTSAAPFSPAGTFLSTFTFTWTDGPYMSFRLVQQWVWSAGKIQGLTCPSAQAAAGMTFHVVSQYHDCATWLSNPSLATSGGGATYDQVICLPMGCYTDNTQSYSVLIDFNGNGQAWVA